MSHSSQLESVLSHLKQTLMSMDEHEVSQSGFMDKTAACNACPLLSVLSSFLGSHEHRKGVSGGTWSRRRGQWYLCWCTGFAMRCNHVPRVHASLPCSRARSGARRHPQALISG
jgi:hypothetical protein